MTEHPRKHAARIPSCFTLYHKKYDESMKLKQIQSESMQSFPCFRCRLEVMRIDAGLRAKYRSSNVIYRLPFAAPGCTSCGLPAAAAAATMGAAALPPPIPIPMRRGAGADREEVRGWFFLSIYQS